MSERVAVRVVVSGRVQGVWFRGWTIERAAKLRLDGWVRNRRDGAVEALFAGEPGAVETMIETCRTGPRLARVDAVERFAATDDGTRGFAQRPTE